MTVYFDKRRNRWCYDFERSGKRYFDYASDPGTGIAASNKTEARKIEQIMKSRIESGLKKSIIRSYTLAQAFAAYAGQAKKNESHWKNQRGYIADLISFFGINTPITEITEQKIWDYIAHSRCKKIKVWTGSSIKPSDAAEAGLNAQELWKEIQRTRSDATINRYLDCLRKTIAIAIKIRDPVTGNPILLNPPTVPKLREIDHLPTPISPENLQAIIAHSPPHLADAIMLTALLGLRRTEVFSLTTNQVDFNLRGLWLKGVSTKGKRDEFIEASAFAMQIIERLYLRAKSLNQINLILWERQKKDGITTWQPIKAARRAWGTALDKAGLTGQHKFHNTKATFVTTAAMLMPQEVVQKLARHKDYKTTQKYIRVVDSLRRDGVEAIGVKLGNLNTATARSPRQNPQTTIFDGCTNQPNLLKGMVGVAGFEPTALSPPD
jgi:integrase